MIESRDFSNAEVLAAEATTDPTTAEAARREYTYEQQQQGRAVDVSQVRTASIGGGQVTWERGSSIDGLGLDRYQVTDLATGEQGEIVDLTLLGGDELTADDLGPDEGVDVEPEACTTIEACLPDVPASGMTASTNMSGGTRLAKYCQTWTYNQNKVTGCVEKLKPNNDGSSTRDYYLYNRWGTAVGHEASGFDWKVTDFDMRSRPHKDYPKRTKGMSDYFPVDSAQLCREGGSVSLGHGSLSFTVGLTNCEEKYPIPDAETKTMGLVYDAGKVFDAMAKGLDYEQEVWTYQDYKATSLGLYNYARFCKGSYANCTATIGKDGW